MFGASYNLQPYNTVYAAGADYEVAGVTSVSISGHAAAGSFYQVVCNADTIISGISNPARAWPSGGETAIVIDGAATFVRVIDADIAADVIIKGEATIAAQYRVGADTSVDISAMALPSASYSVSGDSEIDINADVTPTRIISASDMFAIIVIGGIAETGNYSEETASISVTMHPGQVLIIDTEYYTVTLDGENVIDRYSGAWPWIMPGSRELEVLEIGDTTISTNVIFAEKWL